MGRIDEFVGHMTFPSFCESKYNYLDQVLNSPRGFLFRVFKYNTTFTPTIDSICLNSVDIFFSVKSLI